MNECTFGEVNKTKAQDFKVIGLNSGTKYEVNIFSYIHGLKSEKPFPILSYTGKLFSNTLNRTFVCF
jgi:hypothetical protein